MKSSIIFISLLLFLTSSVLSTSISRNGRCGKNHANTLCPSSRTGPGSCCSSYGWCGRTDDHCLAERGCQSAFGSCIHPYVAPKQNISPDGSCGGKKGYTCQGSAFGDCCSQYGWCGRTSAYCVSGCQNSFGICKRTATSSFCTKSSTSTRSPAQITPQSSSISTTTTPRLFTHLGASTSTSCKGSMKTAVSSPASSSTSCAASVKAPSSSSADTPSVSSLLESFSTSSTPSPSGSLSTASSLVIPSASSFNVVTLTSSDISLSTSELTTSTSTEISITTSDTITRTSSDILSSIPEPVTPTSSGSSISTSHSATPTSSDTLLSTSSLDTIVSTFSTSQTANTDISPSSSASPTPTPTQAVVNPGFEDPTQAPWTLFPGGYQFFNTGDPQYGLKTPRVPRGQGLFASIRQIPTILPGTYLVEFSIKVEGPDPSKCQISLTGIAENNYGRAANSDWNTYSYTLTSAGSDNQFIRIVVSCEVTPQSGFVYFDNITIKFIS